MEGLRRGLLVSVLGVATIVATSSTASAAAPVKLKVIAPKTVVAGAPFSVTVKATKRGKVDRAYRGRVKWKTPSSATGTKLPAAYRFRRSDRGVHRFRGIVLTRAGAQSLTTADAASKKTTGSARLKVVAGPVASLTLEAPPTATVGDPIPLTVTGSDAHGNAIPAGGLGAVATIDPHGTCDGLSCTSTVPGAHVVTAAAGGATDTAQVQLTAGPLASIEVSPELSAVSPVAPVDVSADYTFIGFEPTSRGFTVAGFDGFGNPLGDLTSRATFEMSGGGCVAATCSSSDPGDALVTAEVDGLTGQAGLTVLDFEDTYTMTCQGEHYDVNALMDDGCEKSTSFDGGTTRATARFLRTMSDCEELTSLASSALYSDNRAHTNPTVAGFDSLTGSAPRWFRVAVNDDALCQDFADVRLTTNDTNTCYRLTVIADYSNGDPEVSATANTSPVNASLTLDYSLGAVEDSSSNFYVKIDRICQAPDNRRELLYTLSGEF